MNLSLHGTTIKRIFEYTYSSVTRLYYFTENGVDVFTKDGVYVAHATLASTTCGSVNQNGVYFGTASSGVYKLTHTSVVTGGDRTADVTSRFTMATSPALLSNNITYVDARDNNTTARLLISTPAGIDFITNETTNYPYSEASGCGVCSLGSSFISFSVNGVGAKYAGVPSAAGWTPSHTFTNATSNYTWNNTSVTGPDSATQAQSIWFDNSGSRLIQFDGNSPYNAKLYNVSYGATGATFSKVYTANVTSFFGSIDARGKFDSTDTYCIYGDSGGTGRLIKRTGNIIADMGAVGTGIYYLNDWCRTSGNYNVFVTTKNGSPWIGFYRLTNDSPVTVTSLTASSLPTSNQPGALAWHPTKNVCAVYEYNVGIHVYYFDGNSTVTRTQLISRTTFSSNNAMNINSMAWNGDWLICGCSYMTNYMGNIFAIPLLSNNTLNTSSIIYPNATAVTDNTWEVQVQYKGGYLWGWVPIIRTLEMFEFSGSSIVRRRSTGLTGGATSGNARTVVVSGNGGLVAAYLATPYVVANRWYANFNIGSNTVRDVKFGGDDVLFISTNSGLYAYSSSSNSIKSLTSKVGAVTDVKSIYATPNTKYSSGYLAYSTFDGATGQFGVIDMATT